MLFAVDDYRRVLVIFVENTVQFSFRQECEKLFAKRFPFYILNN